MFNELTMDEMLDTSGGGWREVVQVTAGTIGLAASLPVAVLNPGAGLMLAGGSLACLESGLN